MQAKTVRRHSSQGTNLGTEALGKTNGRRARGKLRQHRTSLSLRGSMALKFAVLLRRHNTRHPRPGGLHATTLCAVRLPRRLRHISYPHPQLRARMGEEVLMRRSPPARATRTIQLTCRPCGVASRVLAQEPQRIKVPASSPEAMLLVVEPFPNAPTNEHALAFDNNACAFCGPMCLQTLSGGEELSLPPANCPPSQTVQSPC